MKLNVPAVAETVLTHEGAQTYSMDPYCQLRRTVLTCMLWEPTFYETGDATAQRIADLVRVVEPGLVAGLACEARSRMQLRHVPLFLLRELARRKGCGSFVEGALERVIQRADELSEFVAMYWKDKKQPLSAGAKRGLASAFWKFDEYRLAKYNRDSKVKLRDVLFMVHAKPKDAEQAALWKRLVDGTLFTPDTWEVELSAGKDKKGTFERLMQEGKLGGLAVLRNLRNMKEAGVNEGIIRQRLGHGISRALPFRFITAARYAPQLEDALEAAMLKAIEGMRPLPGKTGLLIDVSGSMDAKLSTKSETTRMDAACGVAILLREVGSGPIATFSENLVEVPARRGFALRDVITHSQPHSGTYLGNAVRHIQPHCGGIDRLIVITDEQTHDTIPQAFTDKAYIINMGNYQNGVGHRNGWTHIDGWSEAVIDYIREIEAEL